MSFPHWQYFLSIEEDLIRCARYVEFDPKNYDTYSVEFARIIVAAGAEFDAVVKKICKAINEKAKPDNINQYCPIIIGKYPRFTEFTIEIPTYKLEFQPWKGWSENASPDWWSKSYNKIKHTRDSHFESANLLNAILATSGLLAGIVYLYDISYGKFPNISLASSPKLFDPLAPPGEITDANISWCCSAWK